MPAVSLALFDIDGTLLRGTSITHATAVQASLQSVFGVDISLQRIVAAQQTGATAPMLARTLLADVRDDLDGERFKLWEQTLVRDYARLCENLPRPEAFDDTNAVLRRLLESRVRIGLLTGNYRAIARRKLIDAGVWDDRIDLTQGAFGDDGCERDELGALAGSRARDKGFDRIAVVGDTPRDIAAARCAGAFAIAVATGAYRKSDLAGADRVVERLTDVAELLLEDDAVSVPAA